MFNNYKNNWPIFISFSDNVAKNMSAWYKNTEKDIKYKKYKDDVDAARKGLCVTEYHKSGSFYGIQSGSFYGILAPSTPTLLDSISFSVFLYQSDMFLATLPEKEIKIGQLFHQLLAREWLSVSYAEFKHAWTGEVAIFWHLL